MKNIVLTGMMGSGKTTIGKLLAQQLGLEFIDTDAKIEAKIKMSISEVFSKFGEAKFRELEQEEVIEVSSFSNKVISTGGGTILSNQNFEQLGKNGNIVYLKTSSEEIYKRIKNDTVRPLLQTENPKKTIEEILAQRSSIYEKAHIIINTDGKDMKDVADEIIKKVGEKWNSK